MLDPEVTAEGIAFHERAVDEPWVKDYDAIQGEGPTRWATRFDVSQWCLLAAFDDDVRVGGAVVAFGSPTVHMLDGRTDLAVVWDLRVGPEHRASGIGTQLWRAAEAWSVERRCTHLKVETQNINVGACRFYARMGCTLGAIDRFAYWPDLPDEVRLLWYRDLRSAR